MPTGKRRACGPLHVPCVGAAAAAAFAEHLRSRGLDVTEVDGRHVIVPWGGYPPFVLDLAEIAVSGGFAGDDEMTRFLKVTLR